MRHKLFSIEIEEPVENDLSPGKIILQFNEPRVYFGYKFYDHIIAKVDNKTHARLEKVRAMETFLELIRKELMEAFEL